MMSLEINIGLLWDEPVVRGELICDFQVQCWTDCNRWIELKRTAGSFVAQGADIPTDSPAYAVRLAESLSPAHGSRLLEIAHRFSPSLELDLVEAGKQWRIGNHDFDNRVWWPVVMVGSRADAERLLEVLHRANGFDQMGLSVVRLSTPAIAGSFQLTLGDFSARVVRLVARPINPVSVFWLYNVPVGRGFHWEHRETFEYRGDLQLFPKGGGLTAVNRLNLESYLESAVGSEMRSNLPAEFSKAQAIAARSTVLATANRHHFADGFDLCNDDHCQCYQGVRRESEAIISPIRETAGRILVSSRIPHPSSPLRVVDARYAKACGGVSDRYEAVWGGEGPDYFDVRPCGDYAIPDLTAEDQARAFLQHPPPAFCNPRFHPYPDPWDKSELFRWSFKYSARQWGVLIESKIGTPVGEVRSLRPLKRGASGRILILEVTGSAGKRVIYGELAIRRALSDSHLPSSCFVTDQDGDQITLHGGGWGHGVGLCQLGACAMAKQGREAARILGHYYPGAELMSLY